MLQGQNDAILAFCGLVSGTLILRFTYASALLRLIALTWLHFFFDSFIFGMTGLLFTIVALRQMVYILELLRYAVVWLLFFLFRNWLRILGAGALTAISARTAADRLYLIFAFMDIYQDLLVFELWICLFVLAC